MNKFKDTFKLLTKDEADKICGTSLVGFFNVSYTCLVDVLGEPNMENDGYKTDAEWAVELKTGRILTIYNYKNGKNYCGEEGLEVEDITDWHIGSNEKLTVIENLFFDLLKVQPIKKDNEF